MSIQENLARIEEQIQAACRHAGRRREDVQLMAVSKTHPASFLAEAVAAGQRLFGENRVQEFQSKAVELEARGLRAAREEDGGTSTPAENTAALAPPGSVSIHLIGHLQSNKSAKAAELFTAIDTLDSLRLAERLNEAAARLHRLLPVLIEVKLSPEESKEGLEPNSTEFADLVERLPDLGNLRLGGLMTVPPWSEDPETARPYFVQLRHLRDQLAAQHPRLDFSQLSMGMSGDFHVAIEEGSTTVRIGTAIFGKRPKPA